MLSSIEQIERIEIYYFDHGTTEYLCTTDCPPQLSSDHLAKRTSDCATKFWAEFYGSIHIAVAIIVAFLLQTLRFLMYSIVRAIIIGVLQIFADYLVKPLLTILFNGFLQPPLILAKNLFTSICNMVEPIARAIGLFLIPIGDTLRALRFIEIHNTNHYNRERIGSGAAVSVMTESVHEKVDEV